MAWDRVSVGLEDVEDIIEDLSNALVTMLELFSFVADNEA
jgi:hypothetical protein